MNSAFVWIGIIGILAVAFVVLYTRQRKRLQQNLEAAQHAWVQQNEESQAHYVAIEEKLSTQARDFEKRVEQLRWAALVARDAAEIRNLDTLMETVVHLISRKFSFYQAGIFLLDDAGEFAVMQAASSAGGQQMLARGHKLRVAAQGIVGYVAARGEARIALDVGADATWFNSPELPETRSEMGLPLKIRDRVIGVLDVQSVEPEAFTEEDIEVLQTMADQLTLAIQTARLFDENRQTLKRLERLYQEQMGAVWRGKGAGQAYAYDGFSIHSLVDTMTGVGPEASPVRRISSHQLRVPIILREQMIGSLVLERSEVQAPWSNEEIALADEVMVQAGLALENAQLLADSHQRANRQQQLSDISRQFSSSVDMDAILHAALRELGQLPGVAEVAVHLDMAERGAMPPDVATSAVLDE